MIERVQVSADETTRKTLALEFFCVNETSRDVTLVADGSEVTSFIEDSHESISANAVSTDPLDSIDDLPTPIEWDILGLKLPIDEYVKLMDVNPDRYEHGDSVDFGVQEERRGKPLPVSSIRALEADGILEKKGYNPQPQEILEIHESAHERWDLRVQEVGIGGTVQFPRSNDYNGLIQVDSISVVTRTGCDVVRQWLDSRYGFTSNRRGTRRPNSKDYPTADKFSQIDEKTILLQWDRVLN